MCACHAAADAACIARTTTTNLDPVLEAALDAEVARLAATKNLVLALPAVTAFWNGLERALSGWRSRRKGRHQLYEELVCQLEGAGARVLVRVAGSVPAGPVPGNKNPMNGRRGNAEFSLQPRVGLTGPSAQTNAAAQVTTRR